MFDIEEFKKDILGKYRLEYSRNFNYILLSNYWKNDIDLEIKDISFDGLDKMNSSDSFEINSNIQKVVISKRYNQNSPRYGFTFKISTFEQNDEAINYIICVTSDAAYSTLAFGFTVSIIEYDYEGGIYYTDIRKNRDSDENMTASISYYNPETAKIFKSKSEDISIYKKLKLLKILPDKYKEEAIKSNIKEKEVIEEIVALRTKIDENDMSMKLTDN